MRVATCLRASKGDFFEKSVSGLAADARYGLSQHISARLILIRVRVELNWLRCVFPCLFVHSLMMAPGRGVGCMATVGNGAQGPVVCCLQIFLCVTLQEATHRNVQEAVELDRMMRERISSPSDEFSFKSSPSIVPTLSTQPSASSTHRSNSSFQACCFPSWCLRAVAVTCCT